MHVYIYDTTLGSAKYLPFLAKLETRLTDLGLNGKIIRLNPMHNLSKTLQDEAKTGRTVIFVGSDALFNEGVANLYRSDTTIGYIPAFENQPLANALGIPFFTQACEVIAARRLVKLDVGVANDRVFLGELSLESTGCMVDLGNQMHIEVTAKSLLKIINLPLEVSKADLYSPEDGQLDLTINTKQKSRLFKSSYFTSHFRNASFIINSDDCCKLDRLIEIQTPVRVTIVSQSINLIVGKERKF
jgi:diacylglycerol kinase family enzyme